MKKYIDDNNISLSQLRKARFHRYPSVQLNVQDLPGRDRGCQEYGISPSGNGTGYFRKLQERPENLQKESFPLVSVRSVSPSVTRSLPETSPSVPESLSRWSWSFSVSRERIWSGSPTGSSSASTGCRILGIKDDELRARDHSRRGALLLQQGHHRPGILIPLRLGRALGHRRPYRL